MSLQFFKKSKRTVFFLILFSVIVIPIMYSILKQDQRLKIYNPRDVNPLLVDQNINHISRNHKIKPFNLINQNGDTITQHHIEGKIAVVDFFFTTCQTICPLMTGNMKIIQETFKEDASIILLSHSVTPDIDSVSVLKAYAKTKGVISQKWHLLTGDKKQIYNLARKSYMVAKDQGDGGEFDFIHTENFALIDTKGRIRGYYDGTDADEIQRLEKEIAQLKKETY